jgi:hypothetical protein
MDFLCIIQHRRRVKELEELGVKVADLTHQGSRRPGNAGRESRVVLRICALVRCCLRSRSPSRRSRMCPAQRWS